MCVCVCVWWLQFCLRVVAVSLARLYACRHRHHHRICRSTASHSPVLTRGGICVPSTVTYLLYRISVLTPTAVGRYQLLARWPGTQSRILSGIQRAAQTVLGVYLKRTCSHITSGSSAFGVLNDYALYKSTHSLTHAHMYTQRWTGR